MQVSQRLNCLSGVLLAVLCTASSVAAEQEFPGALFEAAKMECVPTCLMCHTSNPGRADTWQSRKLAVDLLGVQDPRTMAPFINPGTNDAEGLKRAWAGYAAAHPQEAAKVQQGLQPQTMQDVCSPKYGCGASVAPPRAATRPSLVAAGILAATLSLLLARRRR